MKREEMDCCKPSGSWTRLSYKLAALFAAVDIACGVIVYTFPNAAHKLLQYLTHSSWQFEITPFDPARFAIGAMLWAVIGLVLGWIIENWLHSCRHKVN